MLEVDVLVKDTFNGGVQAVREGGLVIKLTLGEIEVEMKSSNFLVMSHEGKFVFNSSETKKVLFPKKVWVAGVPEAEPPSPKTQL